MIDSSDNDAQNKNASEIAPEYLTNLQNYLPRKGSRAKIVSDEQEVIELNSSNASEYMYDCMNRKFFTDDAKERISRNNFNQGVEEDPLNDPFASSRSLSLPSSGADAVKRKKSPTKATKNLVSSTFSRENILNLHQLHILQALQFHLAYLLLLLQKFNHSHISLVPSDRESSPCQISQPSTSK